ncbi:MAG: CHAT domain-containing protein, partial [Acidobacteriota bacterium]
MQARVSILGRDLLCEIEDATSVRIPWTDEQQETCRSWTQRYRRATAILHDASIAEIGRELGAWLFADAAWSAWLRGSGPRVLEIAVDETRSDAVRAVLDLPFEILSHAGEPFAADGLQPFVVFRSVRRAADATPRPPRFRNLAAMFMAAAPRGEQELDFEAEEAAILGATERLPMQLFVEESGCLEFLRDRLTLEEPFDVVHLSCHGDILRSGQSVLALETPDGALALTTPEQFHQALGERAPTLAFLSACRTAETDATTPIAEPFVRDLVRAGLGNVLGWDGSVLDRDARHFAEALYAELARHASVPHAVAAARRALLQRRLENPQLGAHWHLARLYVGPEGGGSCCGVDREPRVLRKDAGFKEFLDKANARVRVASAREFVGRRRSAQRILGEFRRGEAAGVLIFGMGNLGKSSLAARVANRLPRHRAVVIYERYDAQAIFERLVEALPPGARRPWTEQWQRRIADAPPALADCLEQMLTEPFQTSPILLIVDDLEQILAVPEPGEGRTPVADAAGSPDLWRASLSAVLTAFRRAESPSRLLLTSRYDFTLPDGRGGNLADVLAREPLRPMDASERRKQLRAAEVLQAIPDTGDAHELGSLKQQALAVSGGNPGLQEILCRPLLSGETAAAQAAIVAVDRWRASGQVPADDNRAQEFFRRVSFETYGEALTGDQRTQLRASTLFSENLPAPRQAHLALGETAGVTEPPRAIDRLIGLGLVDLYSLHDQADELAVNPLARSLVDLLDAPEISRLAAAAVPSIAAAWSDADGGFPVGPRAVELTRLGLVGGEDPATLDAAAYAAGTFLFQRLHSGPAAFELMQPAIERIEQLGGVPSLRLLGVASDAAERIGEVQVQRRWLDQGLRSEQSEPSDEASIRMRLGRLLSRVDPAGAEALLESAAEIYEAIDAEREVAKTRGCLADLLFHRGELKASLRIRQEEELPVYRRLGDVRSVALTQGKIADVLFAQGDLAESLRIRWEDQLPVYKRLGDVREQAVTQGRIADVLVARGDFEEAIRIRREEELPVYEWLGDVRSVSVAKGRIADGLFALGDLEESLRIRREEELPVYERLEDLRSVALTEGRIADLLLAQGELEESLRIRREEQLPVYERLGDVRLVALTQGQIADVMFARGELEESLRIRREEQLPVYERLGDVRSVALTQGQIADVLVARGELEESLRIRREEQLPVYKRLGDVRERAVVQGQIADVLFAQGKLEESLRIRREEQLPVYKRLKDVREWAVMQGRIADVLFEPHSDRCFVGR